VVVRRYNRNAPRAERWVVREPNSATPAVRRFPVLASELNRIPAMLARIPTTAQSLIERGMLIVGSPSTVCKQIETLLNYCPVEYFWLFMQNESIPQSKLMRSLELMTTKVWPNFTDAIGKPRPLLNGITDASAQVN
jgi:hypothetical protein